MHEVGDHGLAQGDAAIIAGHLTMKQYVEAVCF
jgi:hypothetical protein